MRGICKSKTGMRCYATLHKRRQASGGEPRLVGGAWGMGDELEDDAGSDLHAAFEVLNRRNLSRRAGIDVVVGPGQIGFD